MVWMFAGIGSIIFSYIPALWGDGLLSISSVILGVVGGLLGIYVGWKIGEY